MLTLFPFINSEKKMTKKIAWMTDLHLDAAEDPVIEKLFHELASLKPDLILVGGDTCNGTQAFNHLMAMAKYLEKDLYFVLGNHEFYHGSIFDIRKLAQQTKSQHNHLHYLTKESVIEMTPTTALIGHDGWSDGRAGNFMKSTVKLHDYVLIKELQNLSKHRLHLRLNQLGDQAAKDLEKKIKLACSHYSNIMILTHTPPFQAACVYEKHISDDNWAPHFVCKAMGEVLLDASTEYPEKQFVVFCGHSHHLADIHICPNLRVLVGESLLGSPQVQGLIHV